MSDRLEPPPGATGMARARRAAGGLKCRVVDRWPYAVLKPVANRRRARYRQELVRLPPVPTGEGPPDIELHMFCGRAQVDMGMWASWSIMRFFTRPVLYVHSDGTLTEEDFAPWRAIAPEAILIDAAQADAVFSSQLADAFPQLARWRAGYWSARQVIDFHLFGAAGAVVGMDSDVLCFQRPREVAEAFAARPAVFRWTRDLRDYYSADRRRLESLCGLSVPPALNCGFLCAPRLGRADFEWLEEVLTTLSAASVDVLHWAMGQTLYALLAARRPGSGPLPAGYDVTKGRTRRTVVTRHYVSLWDVRPKYFIEGVPRLVRERGAAPAVSP